MRNLARKSTFQSLEVYQDPMKTTLYLLLAAALLSLAACNSGKKEQPSHETAPTTSETAAPEQVADSTIYGTADEFGMSTFTLITDAGDTLEVARTSETATGDDAYGRIYGDLNDGDRYAMTTRDGGEAIGVLINLTQLDAFTKSYRITNGTLVLTGSGRPDTVVIDELTDETFRATGRSGHSYQLKPAQS